MKPITAVFGALALLGMAACTSTGSTSSTVTAGSDAVPQRGLPAQTLDIGECGLFLWSVSGDPTFMFFSKATTQSATVLLGDRAETLRQVSTGGDIFGQFMTEQTWRAPSGQAVEVLLEPGEVLLDGQRVSGGRLKVVDAEGWETIIPVAGARACQAAPDSAPAAPAS